MSIENQLVPLMPGVVLISKVPVVILDHVVSSCLL